jgi:hypothetical protein
MRSRFLSAERIGSLISVHHATIAFKREDMTTWVIADKLA